MKTNIFLSLPLKIFLHFNTSLNQYPGGKPYHHTEIHHINMKFEVDQIGKDKDRWQDRQQQSNSCKHPKTDI